ncbi:hypothetical protein DIS24_g11445 [Lasiodiplodia hormozganensis]|uniref:IDI-2 n=1 Tax=Lasiodiplodia hormozganensis TaxID=869390 RepID=A0AA39WT48_9PEZI|nr:hypothetical protein DIS24_g11445 [Lasiodiplodia hormozganensis]
MAMQPLGQSQLVQDFIHIQSTPRNSITNRHLHRPINHPLQTPTMKFNAILLLAAAAFSPVFSAAVSDAAAECGSLGVMSLDGVAEGVDPASVRKCAEHPLGNTPNVESSSSSFAPVDDSNDTTTELGLEKRACWWGAEYGCTDGYCWKTCGAAGSGKWCWTASNSDGSGPWYTCSTYKNCNMGMACGTGKNCNSCGCSC